MDVLKIIAILQQLATLGGTVAGLVEEARENLSSDDQAKLKAAIDDLEARNAADYQRIRAKLVSASGQG
jgi:hypothetical protein